MQAIYPGSNHTVAGLTYSVLNADTITASSLFLFTSGVIAVAVTPVVGQFNFTVYAFDGVFNSTNTLEVIIHVNSSIACRSVTCPAATSCFSASKCAKGVCMGQQAIANASSLHSCTTVCTCSSTDAQWSTTICGQTAFAPCSYGGGSVTKYCDATGIFSNESTSQCVNSDILIAIRSGIVNNNTASILTSIFADSNKVTSLGAMDLVNTRSLLNSIAILGLLTSNDFVLLISKCMNAPFASFASVGLTAGVTGILGSMVVSFDLVGFVGSTITNAQSNAFVSVVYKLTNNMHRINVILVQVVSAGVLNIIIKGDLLDTAQELVFADLNSTTSMLVLLKTLYSGLYSPVSSIVLNISNSFFALKSFADAVTYQMQSTRNNLVVGQVADINTPNLHVVSQRDDCASASAGYVKMSGYHSTIVPGIVGCKNNTAVTFSWYKNTILFSTRTINPNAISSPVATFSLDSTANLTAPIVITLNITRLPTNVSAACAYYDSSINDWNQKGCTLINTSPVDFGFLVTCNCFFQFDNGVERRRRDTDSPHTTMYFAVIAGAAPIVPAPSTNETVKEKLRFFDIITYISVGITVPLLVTIFLTILFVKKLQTVGRLIIMNLALSLAITVSVFVLAMTNSATQCRTFFAIVFHYFLLASFSWMTLKSFFLWRQFIRFNAVIQTRPRSTNIKSSRRMKLLTYMCLGWGMPALGIAICAGAWPQNYGSENVCWLNGDFIWTFLGPVASMMFMNILFFSMTIRKRVHMVTCIHDERWIKLNQALKASGLFTPVMCIAWVFALFSLQKNNFLNQTVFTVFTLLQGLFLFVFYFAMDKKVISWFSWRCTTSRLLYLFRRRRSGKVSLPDCAGVLVIGDTTALSVTKSILGACSIADHGAVLNSSKLYSYSTANVIYQCETSQSDGTAGIHYTIPNTTTPLLVLKLPPPPVLLEVTAESDTAVSIVEDPVHNTVSIISYTASDGNETFNNDAASSAVRHNYAADNDVDDPMMTDANSGINDQDKSGGCILMAEPEIFRRVFTKKDKCSSIYRSPPVSEPMALMAVASVTTDVATQNRHPADSKYDNVSTPPSRSVSSSSFDVAQSVLFSLARFEVPFDNSSEILVTATRLPPNNLVTGIVLDDADQQDKGVFTKKEKCGIYRSPPLYKRKVSETITLMAVASATADVATQNRHPASVSKYDNVNTPPSRNMSSSSFDVAQSVPLFSLARFEVPFDNSSEILVNNLVTDIVDDADQQDKSGYILVESAMSIMINEPGVSPCGIVALVMPTTEQHDSSISLASPPYTNFHSMTSHSSEV